MEADDFDASTQRKGEERLMCSILLLSKVNVVTDVSMIIGDTPVKKREVTSRVFDVKVPERRCTRE